ncbi:hypothetical protein Btru_034149 [Bulinus truncatus]|nr:hypothetical protein Btru_034149 [Bulinus truncatus]
MSELSKQCLAKLLKNCYVQRDEKAVAIVNTAAANELLSTDRKKQMPFGHSQFSYRVNDSCDDEELQRTKTQDCHHCQKCRMG